MPSCADAGSLVVPRSQEMLQGSCTPGLLTGPWLNQTHSFKNQAKRLVPEAVYDHRNVVSLSPRDRSIQLTHPTQELSFTDRIVPMVGWRAMDRGKVCPKQASQRDHTWELNWMKGAAHSPGFKELGLGNDMESLITPSGQGMLLGTRVTLVKRDSF